MVKPVSNPPNPWSSTHVEWIGEPPEAKLEVYEEEAKHLIAENDSPDVGFRFGINPYRGCGHACAYCLSGDTQILMGDTTTKALADVRPGDVIYGTKADGRYRRYVRTVVRAHWQTRKPAFRVRLDDGTELLASGDHRFLTERGWKHVAPSPRPGEQRPFLTLNDRILGLGPPPVVEASDEYSRSRRRHSRQAQFSLALLEEEVAGTTMALCAGERVFTRRVAAIEDTGVEMPMYDITTGTGDFIANGVISHNCFARPSHKYLGFGAGTDFERRIVAKVNAPEALRRDFLRPSWKGDLVALSGNTDCYQPLEASYRLTRGCLEVFREFRNPVVIITKGLLVRRDVDVLSDLAKVARVSVHVSIPFLDDAMAKALEPGAAAPVRRFEAMKALADAGVPVGISLAPIIPGMNDPQIPELLQRAKDAGATSAFYTLLRLPAEVLPVFTERLTAAFPDRVSKVVSQVKDVRGGKMYDARFGERMHGHGPRWDAIVDLFRVHAKRLGLDREAANDLVPSTFRRPEEPLPLFPGA